MEFEPISESLRDMLVRQGLRLEAGGTTKSHGMKKRAAAVEGADPQVAVTNRGVPAGRRHDGVRIAAGCAEENTHPATTGWGGTAVDLGVEKAIEAAMKNGAGRIVRCAPFLMIVLEGGRK